MQWDQGRGTLLIRRYTLPKNKYSCMLLILQSASFIFHTMHSLEEKRKEKKGRSTK